MGAPALVLSVEQALAPVPDPDLHLRVVLLRPPRLPRLARFAWRETKSFFFTIARSVVSLVTMAVSCTMAARSLAVVVARFVIASTVSCWRYPSSGFAVAL